MALLLDLQKRLAKKAGDQKVCLIKEGTIAYLVLNDKVNVWNPSKIKATAAILD